MGPPVGVVHQVVQAGPRTYASPTPVLCDTTLPSCWAQAASLSANVETKGGRPSPMTNEAVSVVVISPAAQ